MAGRGRQGVVVNLLFDTAEARQLGIEGHVCELQLITRGFAERAQVRVGQPQLLMLASTAMTL
jgi:hypothetical protein